MLKLEGELAEIKKMLQIQQREQQNTAAAFGDSDAAAGIAAFDRMYGDDVAIGGSSRQADLASRVEDLKDREEI